MNNKEGFSKIFFSGFLPLIKRPKRQIITDTRVTKLIRQLKSIVQRVKEKCRITADICVTSAMPITVIHPDSSVSPAEKSFLLGFLYRMCKMPLPIIQGTSSMHRHNMIIIGLLFLIILCRGCSFRCDNRQKIRAITIFCCLPHLAELKL